jgi:hypothetical protein
MISMRILGVMDVYEQKIGFADGPDRIYLLSAWIVDRGHWFVLQVY